MPDYKLEIEIDVAKFTRDINKGLKDANINFGGGSSGGTPKGPDVSAQWDEFTKIMEKFLDELEEQTKLLKELNSKTKRSHKTLEIIHKADMESIKLKHTLNSQYAILRSTLVRDNMAFRQMGGLFSNIGQVVGGRAGAGIGRMLDTQLKYMQAPPEIEEYLGPGKAGGETAVNRKGKTETPVFTSGKKGGIPQMVKIAGFAAGLAGAAGLGKLIIDSSPLLQAMFKIVNVGIMFMLRPIGDMFALLIRPVSIIFLKYAAGFYKDTLKYFPAWDKFGQAIAIALTGSPIEALTAADAGFKELDRIAWVEEQERLAKLEKSPGGIAITPEERAAITAGNQERKDEIRDIMKELRDTLGAKQVNRDKITAAGSLAAVLGREEPKFVIDEAIKATLAWLFNLGKDAEEIDKHATATTLSTLALLGFTASAQEAIGQFHEIKLADTLSIGDSLAASVTRVVKLFDSISINDQLTATVTRGGESQEFLEILERMTAFTEGGTGEHEARAQALEVDKMIVDLYGTIQSI